MHLFVISYVTEVIILAEVHMIRPRSMVLLKKYLHKHCFSSYIISASHKQNSVILVSNASICHILCYWGINICTGTNDKPQVLGIIEKTHLHKNFFSSHNFSASPWPKNVILVLYVSLCHIWCHWDNNLCSSTHDKDQFHCITEKSHT